MVKKKEADVLVYQMRIILEDIEPVIWRMFQVRSDVTLFRLHEYIQVVMGWENCHMHEFRINGESYGMSDMQEEAMFGTKMYNEEKFKIIELVEEGDVFEYVYDFGDDWRHKIEVEKVLGLEAGVVYPVCLAGERACPLEDCGGPWAYAEMLGILKDSGHEDYEHYHEWAGDGFDPEGFDVDRVNSCLRKF